MKHRLNSYTDSAYQRIVYCELCGKEEGTFKEGALSSFVEADDCPGEPKKKDKFVSGLA